jgi:hypothetical protein
MDLKQVSDNCFVVLIRQDPGRNTSDEGRSFGIREEQRGFSQTAPAVRDPRQAI